MGPSWPAGYAIVSPTFLLSILPISRNENDYAQTAPLRSALAHCLTLPLLSRDLLDGYIVLSRYHPLPPVFSIAFSSSHLSPYISIRPLTDAASFPAFA